MNKLLLLFPVLLLFGCEQETTAVAEAECFQLGAGTHLPRLASEDSTLYLSFVHSFDAYDELHLATTSAHYPWFYLPDRPLLVDSTMFINWADFPSVIPLPPPSPNLSKNYPWFFAHYLKYSGSGTYDYDIMTMEFGDRLFFEPYKLHQDTVAAEHGFLSSAPLPGGGLQVSWLDGRNTKAPQPPKAELGVSEK